MTYDPIETLLVSAWKELSQYLPEEASHAALYLDLERLVEETDDTGKATPRAHRAKARLGNAFLVEETNAKSKAKVVKNQAKVEKELATLASRFLVLLVTARANAARIAHIESVEERQLAVGENREQHDPESKFALASPFIDKLAKAGTSPSAIGRMPALMVSFIALMINDHAVDPKFRNPDNVWNRIVQSGILEAYLGNLDEEHLKVIARAVCEREEQTNEWAKRAREELDLPAGMEDRFLEAAARIRDAARSLTDGEVRAYEDAYKLQDDWDIDQLAKLLEMEEHEDRIRLRTMCDFIHRAIAPLKRDWKMEMHLSILKREIDAIAPQAKWHKDWKAELRERLEITFERLDTMTSIEAFDALLRSGLAVSDADWEFTKRLERDVLDGHFIAFENEVRAACRSGRYFKVYDNRVVYSHEPDFETIEAETWTGHDWLQEYGSLPGEGAEGREPGDQMSYSPINDPAHETEKDEDQSDTRRVPVLPFADAGADAPLIEDGPADDTVILKDANGSAAVPAEHFPGTTDISSSDAVSGDGMEGGGHSRAGNGSLDDVHDDANPGDYDRQKEDSDLEPLDSNLRRGFADDSGSLHRPDGASAPATPIEQAGAPPSGATSPGEVSSKPEPPSQPSTRPRPYYPHQDKEKDDWDE